MRVAVLIPCYNEEPTIAKVVADFRAAVPDAVVYVYDNNSVDAGARLAAEAGAVVVPEYRQGKGFVVRSMFRDVDADCYIMVDGDDTYPVEDAVALSRHVLDGRADMAIGDRLSSTYFEQNKRQFHGAGNRLVRFLVNRIFRSDVHDIMTGCRCFSRRFVRTFPITSSGFEIETEMTIHALDKCMLVVEEPIAYRDRGEGSHSKLNTFSDGLRVLRTIATLFRDYRPLQFFGIVSALLMTAAVAMFLPPLDEYVTTGYVSRVPTLMVSLALGTGSLLSLMCGVILGSMRTQARQTYELFATLLTDADRGRGAADEGA
jgi:glycosyltransferase involved in cell wall biosynthesis